MHRSVRQPEGLESHVVLKEKRDSGVHPVCCDGALREVLACGRHEMTGHCCLHGESSFLDPGAVFVDQQLQLSADLSP